MSRVVHFEFYSTDAERSVEFFQKAFGWELNKWGDQPYWLTATGEGEGIEGGVTPSDTGSAFTMNTLTVDDLDSSIAAVAEAGGKVLGEPMPIPEVGTWVRVEDPGGVVFGMMQPASDTQT